MPRLLPFSVECRWKTIGMVVFPFSMMPDIAESQSWTENMSYAFFSNGMRSFTILVQASMLYSITFEKKFIPGPSRRISSVTTSGSMPDMSMSLGRCTSTPPMSSRGMSVPSFIVKTFMLCSIFTSCLVSSNVYVPSPPTIFGGYSHVNIAIFKIGTITNCLFQIIKTLLPP